MRPKRAVELLQKYHPTTVREVLRWCGFPLHFVQSGGYRDVYKILESDLVLKIPKVDCQDEGETGFMHALHEYHSLKRILRYKKKYEHLQPYMPEFFFFDNRTGISLMREYKVIPFQYGDNTLHAKMEKLVSAVTGVQCPDVYQYGNLGRDKKGNVKLLDLGRFVK